MKDISLHVLDIVQNSLAAGSTSVTISIDVNRKMDYLVVSISDNGRGMTREFLSSVTDPFTTTRTTRKVGLGLPLLKQNAERTGGDFSVSSELGKGTQVVACFRLSSIDCLPLGDMGGVITMLICSNPDVHFEYKHKVDGKEYCLDTQELHEALGGVAVSDLRISRLIKEMVCSNLEELQIASLG